MRLGSEVGNTIQVFNDRGRQKFAGNVDIINERVLDGLANITKSLPYPRDIKAYELGAASLVFEKYISLPEQIVLVLAAGEAVHLGMDPKATIVALMRYVAKELQLELLEVIRVISEKRTIVDLVLKDIGGAA